MTTIDFCNCKDVWNAVIPKPPCPEHGRSEVPMILRGPKSAFRTIGPVDGPAYDGPTEEFVFTLGILEGYGSFDDVAKPKKVIRDALNQWSIAADNVGDGIGTIPAVVSIQHCTYPGGREPVLVFRGTCNPYWAKDPEEWRENVLACVKAMRQRYNQTTAQVTFTSTWLVYYRDET